MPKFDDRFARQNRCEPPPEFPLASPCSGIVHHLSGPNSYAHTQIHPMTSGSVDGAPRGRGSHLRSLSFRARVFHPNTRIDVRLLGPCFKTGRLQPLRQHPSRSAVLGPGWRHCASGYKTARRQLHSRRFCPAAGTDAGLVVGECTNRLSAHTQVWPQALPFQQFHVLFNSLSKVLFIFRSLYLCAIGLRPIFSFR